MNRHNRIPSTSALVAFEAVARLGGVGRAAAELNTSQSAVSRHIKSLEVGLGTTLFDRVGRHIVLNHAGKTYLSVVSSALESLTAVAHSLRSEPRDVLIACTHEISHLVLLPVFADLRKALKGDGDVRIMTCEYDTVPAMIHLGVDIIFEYSIHPPTHRAVPIVAEQIRPVASPQFIDRFADILNRPPTEWTGLPCLNLVKRNNGWATWDTWFQSQNIARNVVITDAFENYVYLLEAAAAGVGLALGWRGFIERYTSHRALVPVSDVWVPGSTTLYAVPTRKGELNSNASHCLRALSDILPVRALSEG